METNINDNNENDANNLKSSDSRTNEVNPTNSYQSDYNYQPNLQNQDSVVQSVQPSQYEPLPSGSSTNTNNKNLGQKRKNFLLVVVVVLFFSVILLVIAFFFVLSKEKNLSSNSSNLSDNFNQTEKIDKNTIVDRISHYSESITSQYPNFEKLPINGTMSINLYDNQTKLFYAVDSPEGWNLYLNNTDKSSQESDLYAPYEKLVETIKDDGFKEFQGKQYQDEWTGEEGDPVTMLEKEGVVCSIRRFNPKITLTCTEEEKLANQVKNVFPFYEAYFKGTNITDNEVKQSVVLYISLNEISNSDNYPEYQTVDAGVSTSGYGSRSNFYRKDDGKWQLGLHGMQMMPECHRYDNTDMQKAFYKESCHAGKIGEPIKESTVGEFYRL